MDNVLISENIPACAWDIPVLLSFLNYDLRAIAEDVRTRIQRQIAYVHVPDLTFAQGQI